jgi:Co/Zn/Cd efflux system component
MLPLPIRLNEAISVATIGLVVNVISAWLPRGGQLAGLSDRGECIDNRLHNH